MPSPSYDLVDSELDFIPSKRGCLRLWALSSPLLKSHSCQCLSLEIICCSQQSVPSAAGAGYGIFTCMDPGLCNPFLQKDHLGTTLEMEEYGTSFSESSEASAGYL